MEGQGLPVTSPHWGENSNIGADFFWFSQGEGNQTRKFRNLPIMNISLYLCIA